MSRSRVYFVFSLSSLCFLGCSRETLKDESCACTSNCKIADRYIQNGTCRKENVALGNEATMSEPYNEEAYGGRSGPACLANNGNMNRTYLGESQRQSGGPQCIHTQTKNGGGWWQVDLGRNYLISSIAVYGRVDFLDRMPTSITVNGQTCYTGMPNEKDLIIDLNQTTVGQTVNVSTNASVEFLNICQVQVWVDQCSCISDNITPCAPEGHCRMENVALGKLAYMSSVYVNQTAQAADQACLAVDGSPGLRHNTITSSNCIMSSPADAHPWWEVDLGQEYAINKITVYTSENYLDNMKGIEISVDEQTCYTFSITTQPNITNDIKCSQARKGKLVTLTSRENKQLVLCEVQIWVCISGFYGESCQENCGKCNNATCDIENGTCPTSCELGFTGPLCQETCGHCLNNSTCNPVNGTCDEGCIQGFEGHSCKECAQGYYGNGSVCTPCGHCINGSACNNLTGICDDCEYGWQQPQCNECDFGFYGENCTEVCGKCQNNTSCDVINGTCSNGCELGFGAPLCNECDHGYYGNESTCIPCGHCTNGTACDNKTGNCTDCEYGWQQPLCSVCSWGLYAENCTETCGKCRNNSFCDVVNGTCPTGCENGFTDPLCKECDLGLYGENCTEVCGRCQNNTNCDLINGTCSTGCELGFGGPLCNGCDERHYGSNCTLNCGHCFNSTCDSDDGHCEDGCEAGWWNITCHEECPLGFYGHNCNETCGHCFNSSTCNPANGTCVEGCIHEYNGHLCKECAQGYYGNESTCILCGNCINGSACNNITGDCDDCENGWQYPLCNVCDDKHYDSNCSSECGHCFNNECNKLNGICNYGCEAGWRNSTCEDECPVGFYGRNCEKACGRCLNSSDCDPVNGSCAGSCLPGSTGTFCSELSNNNNGDDIAGIVGGVIAAVVVALMIIVIVIFIRRRHRDKAPSTQTDDAAHTNDKMSSSITTDKSALISPIGVQGEDNLRNSRPSESLYASIENSSAPLYGNLPSPTTSSNESKHLSIGDSQKTSRDINNSDFEMSVVTPQGTNKSRCQVYENVVVPMSAERPLVFTKRTDDCQSIDTQQDIDTILGESDVIYNNENIYSTFQPLDAAFQLDSLQCSLLASLGCGQLSKQFQDLPKGMIHPHTIGLKQENLRKNRFKALCPYDKNRVKLNRSKDDNDNDYINASYIKGHQRDRAYIAAQGPREHTVDDMWLMIWQENISQIVMLTNIKEEGKDKCAEYWPSKNTTQTYGHVSVTGANEEARANFVIRTFSLKFKGKSIQRQVEHYHYVTWPDHGVPSVPALVSFWRFVHERAVQNAPLLVHCSAGIGRSGTYIALDIAMEMASNGGEVNVQKIVTDLREDRVSMVQTESQYRFLHEVILEAYSSRSTGMNLEQFEVKVTEPINAHNTNTFIDTEFKMLQQMGEFLPKPSVSMATDQENLGKNRNMNALPDDKYLAYLGVPVKGRNSYINAVFLSSFRHHRGILLTQLPLPETLVDIWRLVDSKDVKTIVSIESKNDHKTIQNYCQYWPKTGRQQMTTGPYRILMSSSTALTEHLTSYNLSLKTENKTRDVHLLHYTNWTSEIPEDTACVIQLVQVLNKGHLDKDDSPVLVQCIDGAAKSGLFCVLWNAISRLSCDQEIDVYLTARDVQIVRRQAVTSEVQYRYCYQVAQDYLHSGVYQNT